MIMKIKILGHLSATLPFEGAHNCVGGTDKLPVKSPPRRYTSRLAINHQLFSFTRRSSQGNSQIRNPKKNISVIGCELSRQLSDPADL